MVSAAQPQLNGVFFEDPRLHFSPMERRLVRLIWGLTLGVLGLASIILLWRGFPRMLLSPEYVPSLRLSQLQRLLSPEFSLGLLLGLFLTHELLESRRGRKSLRYLKSAASPTQGNAAVFLHPATVEALWEIANALRRHDPSHLPYATLAILAKTDRIRQLLGNLEVDWQEFLRDLDKAEEALEGPAGSQGAFSIRDPSFQQLLARALQEARELEHDYILPEDLFFAVAAEASWLKNFFARWNISVEDIRTSSYWMGGRRRRWGFPRRRAVKHRIMNRAWTARPTYLLDRYAQDLTDLAREGYAGFLVGHETEVEAVMRILNRLTKNNVLLVGEAGSGKTTILERLAFLITQNRVPDKLADKRLAVLDVGMLVAGARGAGDIQARTIAVVEEIVKAGNVILAIPEIHTLARAGEGEGVSLSTVLGPVFSRSAFQVIGLTDPKNYHLFIEPHASFKNHFEVVQVGPISSQEALRVLLVRARLLQELEGVEITYPAVRKTIELAERYLHDRPFPAKAIDFLTEAVEVAKRPGKKRLVSAQTVVSLVAERTGIPVSAVTMQETQALLNLEEALHQRIVDQDEAVRALAGIIRQSRAGVRRQSAPVGSFLFVGPTGVGKTECAKALADVYFQDPKAMLRFDMSEYQTRESLWRLIGSPDGQETGQLSEQVKRKPYALLLLDEFEKAHPNILDVFLQILDDGRVTDAAGTTVDFTNAIIIATSNAHSVFIVENLASGKAIADIATELKEKLTAYFKPELLNRFDEIIVFKPLSPADITAVAWLQLKTLSEQLAAEQGINLKPTERAVEKLVELGYNPAYGVRPLRHVIRRKARDLIAVKILRGELARGDGAILDWNGTAFSLTKHNPS